MNNNVSHDQSVIIKKSLASSLDRASKNVQSWPLWKQHVAGVNRYSVDKENSPQGQNETDSESRVDGHL